MKLSYDLIFHTKRNFADANQINTEFFNIMNWLVTYYSRFQVIFNRNYVF